MADYAVAGAGFLGSLVNAWSQRKNRQMQIDLQREAWAREDTAVQRRRADLEAAGINPVMAAGSAAQASGPIKLGAPQIDVGKGVEMAHAIAQIAQAKASVGQTRAQTSLLRATEQKVRAETVGVGYANQYAGSTLQDRIRSAAAVRSSDESAAEVNRVEARIADRTGDARLASALVERLESAMMLAWRSGADSLRIDVKNQDEEPVTIDLTDFRNPAALNLASAEVALHVQRNARDMSDIDLRWYRGQKVLSVITSLLGSGASYFGAYAQAGVREAQASWYNRGNQRFER